MYRELQYKVTDLRDALSSNKICMYHKNLSAVDVFHYSWVLRPPAAEEAACQSDCFGKSDLLYHFVVINRKF